MDEKRKVMLASGLAAALATSAIVAGVAFATPSTPTPDPKVTTAAETAEAPEAGEAAETDGINHEFDGEEVGENGNGIPDANEATEAQ